LIIKSPKKTFGDLLFLLRFLLASLDSCLQSPTANQ
jgi:hypothetical protein